MLAVALRNGREEVAMAILQHPEVSGVMLTQPSGPGIQSINFRTTADFGRMKNCTLSPPAGVKEFEKKLDAARRWDKVEHGNRVSRPENMMAWHENSIYFPTQPAVGSMVEVSSDIPLLYCDGL